MPSGVNTTHQASKSGRPFLVTLLAIVVLFIAILHLLRLIQTITSRQFLESLPGVSINYLIISGLVISIIGFILAVGLWFGKSWAAKASRVIAPIYVVYDLIERGYFAWRAERPANWLLWLLLSAIALVFVFGSLNNRDAKHFFGEVHD